jgi:hypothetical protein
MISAFGTLGTLGAVAMQNPQLLGEAARFAPRAPRAAAHFALRFAGVSGDDATALQNEGVPAWALLLAGVTAGAVLGAAVGKRYPKLTKYL